MKDIVWTEEMDNVIREGRSKRWTWEAISEELGVGRVLCTKRAREIGMAGRVQRGVLFNDDLDRKLTEARVEKGLPWDEVSEQLGFSRDVCIRRASQLGLPMGRLKGMSTQSQTRRKIRGK